MGREHRPHLEGAPKNEQGTLRPYLGEYPRMGRGLSCGKREGKLTLAAVGLNHPWRACVHH